MSLSPYRHTQIGTLILIALGGSLALLAIAYVRASDAPAVLWTVMVILALCLANFYALTVEVTTDTLTVALGPGLLRKQFRILDLDDARRVRIAWYNGWGIRLTQHGWLWNVSGLDAVEMELANGSRFRIGTDDTEGLLAAIQTARAQARR
jgi:hypothetical protein